MLSININLLIYIDMALFRITVTRRKNTAGMLIEPGMSIEMASFANNPITNIQEYKKVNHLFMNHFGVDLEKMGALNSSCLQVDKVK